MAFVFKTSKQEIHDLIEAWIFISLAFAILLSGGRLFSLTIIKTFILAALTVGIGFLFHEMAHKIVAQRYGCFAEFRASIQMLVLALIMSFFGFLIAAPGAVMISGRVSRAQNGKIAIAGPIVNLVLSLLFVPLFLLATMLNIGLLLELASYGIWINAFLAFFNMLPFFVLDGKKVMMWSREAYFAVVIPALIVMFSAIKYVSI
ncbi:MAG: metalloprotease [Nanoarchaeota archaeon]|nr:metalloprotease [DPANN group archaeon]MBL7116885.1 metalloprotease [Nanoarchaeota archaeon]